MNIPLRICLFFSEKSMTGPLRDFFQSQRNCLITGFFTDNHFFIRDISASRPHLVIIQFPFINASEKRKLRAIFPNTMIETWNDSKLDQEKFEHLVKAAAALPLNGFTLNDEALALEIDETHRRNNYSLTNREAEVLQLLANGKSYQSVCDELHIGYETIRSHSQHICAKLKVKRITAAVAKAIKEKVVE